MSDGHPKHSNPGPFYVADGECISCGVPEHEAGELMSHREADATSYQCFFQRQPATAAEVDRAIRAVWSSCVRAVRYGGRNRKILRRLAELGLAEQCDHRLRNEPAPVVRSRVTFLYRPPGGADRMSVVRKIAEFIATALTKDGEGHTRAKPLKFGESGVSFVYEWGLGLSCGPWSAGIGIQPLAKARWLLRVDGGAHVAVWIHDILSVDPRYRGIRWYTAEEWSAPRKAWQTETILIAWSRNRSP